ncbi:hypothetical protein T484DRAFT_1800878 [Baffinella frigidus]|nr:hypothetical protein T484DRAFT_1800878 [Cryptophyta sp. CCMP2293]
MLGLIMQRVHGGLGKARTTTDAGADQCSTQDWWGVYHNAIAMLGLIMQRVHGDLVKAGILYGTVLQSDPDHVLTLDHKCSLLCVQHHTEEAMLLHKRVCTLDPNHTKKVDDVRSDVDKASVSLEASGVDVIYAGE